MSNRNIFAGVGAVVVLAVVGPVLLSLLKTRSLSGGIDAGAIDQAAFQVQCVAVANDWRRQFSLGELEGDAAIQEALRSLAEERGEGASISLTTVFEHVQTVVPDANSLSASVSYATGLEALKKQLSEWDDLVIDEYQFLSTWLIPEKDRIGCVVVLAQKIPPFSLEELARGGGTFANECPRCGDRHAVELKNMRRTIVLSCPHCEKEYDLIAYDSTGKYRRAPEFLDRFVLPKPARESDDALEEVYQIWTAIREKCHYEHDGKNGGQLNEERWQTPGETYAIGRGDCEDTSILLADALLSAGHEAKVAIGRNQKVGEHAWCVVKLNGEQYLLETTGGKPRDKALPRVSEVGKYYVPRQLFDRDSVYFRRGEGDVHDYWSDVAWDRIDMEEAFASAAPVVTR